MNFKLKSAIVTIPGYIQVLWLTLKSWNPLSKTRAKPAQLQFKIYPKTPLVLLNNVKIKYSLFTEHKDLFQTSCFCQGDWRGSQF